MRFKDFGGLLGGHPGTVDQPVGLVQRGDGLGAESVPLQTDDVDAADLGGVALDSMYGERRGQMRDMPPT